MWGRGGAGCRCPPKPACLHFRSHCGRCLYPSRLTARTVQGGTGLAPLAFRRASFSHGLNNSGLSLLGPGPPLAEKYASFPHPEPKGAASDSHLTDLQPLYGLGVGPVPQLWFCPGHTSLGTALLWDASILSSPSRPSQTAQSSPFCSCSIVRAELLDSSA